MSSQKTTPAFILTKEYRRFAEFCDACRRYRYIGLCYGPPGVGKTLSARHYTKWDQVEVSNPYAMPPVLKLEKGLTCDTIFYTPSVANSPGHIEREIGQLRADLEMLSWYQTRKEQFQQQMQDLPEGEEDVEESASRERYPSSKVEDPTTLILVDEADRLKMAGLEQMRDIFDRSEIGLVLIGMPGLEKRLSRYAQLYSRVGFIHAFHPMSAEEMRHLLQEKWKEMGRAFTQGDFTDEEAVTAIIRVTGGNFRLLNRLLAQMERILQINELQTITREVVEAAQESLVIGNI